VAGLQPVRPHHFQSQNILIVGADKVVQYRYPLLVAPGGLESDGSCGDTELKEIAALAKACGLPDFRYYAFEPVTFEEPSRRTEITDETTQSPDLQPEAASADAGLAAPPLLLTPVGKPAGAPVHAAGQRRQAASYPMLVEIAAALPRPVSIAPGPVLSKPGRRRVRAAGRAATAAVRRD
jgi:hypothetical protein